MPLAVALTVVTLAFAALMAAPGRAVSLRAEEPAYAAVKIGTFTNPVHVATAPGESDSVFVVQRSGQVLLLRNEQEPPSTFLDISDLVRSSPDDPGAIGEQGLLSIAFAPDYEQTRRFYVAYTNVDGDVEVDEFLRDAALPDQANRDSRRVVITIRHRIDQNHNGGQLQFGPRDLLYISVGDGGSPDDHPLGEPAPDLHSLLGKILRIDPQPRGDRAYAIPPSNPFVGRDGKDEIFAYGFRNPWRFSIDRGRIAIGDVGRGREEEVDFMRLTDASGANFGWPEYEGDLPFDPTHPGQDPPVFPIHTYSHDDGSCAITGGPVIRDAGLPDLGGRYIYADYCLGEIRALRPHADPPSAHKDGPLGIRAPQLSSFGVGVDGQIYFVELTGGLFRIEPAAR